MTTLCIPYEKENLKKSDRKKIRCTKCDGYYEIKDGKYGAFGGCSNFPKCKSTLNFHQLIHDFFRENGYQIYRWKRECWKCSRQTDVYSYYLLYELAQSYPFFDSFSGIGLSDLPSLDNYLCELLENISSSYSRTVNDHYVANHCQYCGALQGYNYVVEDPHEIFGDLIIKNNMDKYLFTTIPFQTIETSLSEIKDCFEELRTFFIPEE